LWPHFVAVGSAMTMGSECPQWVESCHKSLYALKMTQTAIRARLLATIIGSYVAALTPLLLFGPEGVWWIGILLTGSTPLILVAAILALVFPRRIIARPLTWALCGAGAAIAVSILAMWWVTGTSVGAVAIVIAVPAALIFWWLIHVWKTGPVSPAVE